MTHGNLILMHGEDTFSIKERIDLWKNEFIKRYDGDTNINEIDGDSTTVSDIIDAISVLPFLSDKRLVLVKNFLSEQKADEQKKLAGKLADIPDTTVLVFYELKKPDKKLSLFKHLTKTGKTYEFEPLKGNTLNQWIIDRTTKRGGNINIMTASYLAQYVGSDLWKLANEIDKLSTYKEGSPIGARDIDLLTRSSAETNIFKLTDQIGSRRIQDALKTLHELLESGEELPYVFAMIVRQFRLLIQVKDLLRKGFQKQQIIDRLKLHPFVVTNVIAQAGNFEPDQLKKIHSRLLEIDTKFKTGKIQFLATDKNQYLLQIERLIVA